MNQILNRCPICSSNLSVTRLHCDACGTTIEGQFSFEAFVGLSTEQLEFVKMFVKNEGKLNRLEVELGMSYPTLRARLLEIIRAMGFEPGREEPPAPTARLSDEERRRILDDLDAGRISMDQAMLSLKTI